MSERNPITKVRSEWEEGDPIVIGGVSERIFRRRTGDGVLQVITGREPAGWHMSISFVDHRDRPSRYPRWDEIADARYEFCPEDITMAMLLPPMEEYVAVHDSCFHLHELAE